MHLGWMHRFLFNIKRDTMMELLLLLLYLSFPPDARHTRLFRLFILKMNRWAGHTTNTHPSTLSLVLSLIYRRINCIRVYGRTGSFSSLQREKSVEDRFEFLQRLNIYYKTFKIEFFFKFPRLLGDCCFV
jgi:hypothetical protein